MKSVLSIIGVLSICLAATASPKTDYQNRVGQGIDQRQLRDDAKWALGEDGVSTEGMVFEVGEQAESAYYAVYGSSKTTGITCKISVNVHGRMARTPDCRDASGAHIPVNEY